jgi:hypothetical protein
MKRKRFSEEQIIKMLQAHEAGVPDFPRSRPPNRSQVMS